MEPAREGEILLQPFRFALSNLIGELLDALGEQCSEVSFPLFRLLFWLWSLSFSLDAPSLLLASDGDLYWGSKAG